MKLKFIDSIRGIAILMVILVHVSQNVPITDSNLLFFANYGQLGVQLFFVASAFTLCLSADKRTKESKPNLKFAIRRYFRIAPAYYTGIVLYFLIRVSMDKYITGNFFIPEQYSALSVLSNILFFHGFYEPGNNTIVPGGWSIGTEMAFYAIFPILFKIGTYAAKSFVGISFSLFIGIALCFFCLYIFYLNGIYTTKNYFLYFNLINQLPVFLIGMYYYFYREKFLKIWNKHFSIILFLLFTTLSMFLFSKNLNFLFPSIAAISFVFLLEIFRNYEVLNNKLLTRIGQLSYSMYLLHFVFAYYITPFLVNRIFIGNQYISLIFFYLFTIAGTFILAILSEKYIEKPGIQVGKNIIKKL